MLTIRVLTLSAMDKDIDERFTEALHGVARGWRVGLDRRLRFLGLGQAGWITIAQVAKSGEPMSQTELADAVGVENATMATMLDRLARDGMVKRQPSANDRRVKLVVLTPAGKTLVGKLRRKAREYRHELLDDIDCVELEQALAVLARIQAKIEAVR